MPRVAGGQQEDLQSKWASLWYMQQAQDGLGEREAQPEISHAVIASLDQEPQPIETISTDAQKERAASVWRRQERVVDSLPQVAPRAPAPEVDLIAPPLPSWDDAIRSVWTRTLQAVRIRMRRRDAAIVMTASLALLLLLLVAAWPTPSSSHLTWFESVLVELGLAQVPSKAPAAPIGNPDVRVWVDVHTALYYCPGSDLYGKTPGGKFEAQHDAQEDQFEPATGKVCE